MLRRSLSLLIILGIFTYTAPTTSNVSGGFYSLNSPLRLNQIPENDTSIPDILIVGGVNQIDVGGKINLLFGMRNVTNPTIIIAGYNYSLVLLEGIYTTISTANFSSILASSFIHNGTTGNTLISHVIETADDDALDIFYEAGNYSVSFVINSTERGLLSSTISFEVLSSPGSNLKFVFNAADTEEQISSVKLEINETATVLIVLSNFGEGEAFNVMVDRISFDDHIRFANTTFPFELGSLLPSEKITFNFTVFRDNFGIGDIRFQVTSNDPGGPSNVKSFTLRILTLPDIQGDISSIAPKEIINGESIKVSTTVGDGNNRDLVGLTITLELTSDKINFVPSPQPYDSTISTYEFTGDPIDIGITQISLTIVYLDDTTSKLELMIIDVSFQTIVSPDDVPLIRITDVSVIILIITLTLLSIIVIFFLLLNYRKDIRNKFLRKVFGVEVLDDLSFSKSSIVVDGSNVAWEETSNSGKPNLANIELAIKELQANKFTDITVVADAALRYQIEDRSILDDYGKKGTIKVLPAKVAADGFILRLSIRTGALILSNDLFREFRETYAWIDERRVPYSILNGKLFLHPTFDL